MCATGPACEGAAPRRVWSSRERKRTFTETARSVERDARRVLVARGRTACSEGVLAASIMPSAEVARVGRIWFVRRPARRVRPAMFDQTALPPSPPPCGVPFVCCA